VIRELADERTILRACEELFQVRQHDQRAAQDWGRQETAN